MATAGNKRKKEASPKTRRRDRDELCRRENDIRAKARGRELDVENEQPRAGSSCEASELRVCDLRDSDALECKNPWRECA